MKVTEIIELLGNYDKDDELIIQWWGLEEFEHVDPKKWPAVVESAMTGKLFEQVAQDAHDSIEDIIEAHDAIKLAQDKIRKYHE
jgi:hypothetical protein